MKIKKLLAAGMVVAMAFSFVPQLTSGSVSAMSEVQAASLKLSEKSVVLRPTYTRTLKLGNIAQKKCTWKSKNSKVATVSKKGLVLAKKSGKTIISCAYKGKTYKCSVTVVKNLSIEDFAYDKTVESFNPDLGDNLIEYLKINTESQGLTAKWDYSPEIAGNLRGLSVGATYDEVFKKYGYCDTYADKNTEVTEWINVTQDFDTELAPFTEKASYICEYYNTITYEGVDYVVIKVLYFDDSDHLMGSTNYVRYANL